MSTPKIPEGFDPKEMGVEQGIFWMTNGGPLGAINGYAYIPEGHRWRGLGYSEIPSGYDFEGEEVKEVAIRVHGGLTFGSNGWVGFDTAHFGDIWPTTPEFFGENSDQSINWTHEKVIEETKKLARQIAEASS